MVKKENLEEYEYSEEELKDLFTIDKDAMDKLIEDAKEVAINKIITGKNMSYNSVKELVEKAFKNISIHQKIEEIINASSKLFILSIITLGHEDKTRYPLENFNPIEYYTSDLPLVKHFPEFVEILYDVLDRIGKFTDLKL